VNDLALEILAEMRFNAAKARAYADRGGDDWHHDELIVDAVANRVREVTELATYRFPEEAKPLYPEIPWDQLARARHFYTHHYSRLDPEQLRETVTTDLPVLIHAVDVLHVPELTEEVPLPDP
jgi:uncharacterized protein with HEPN domain